MRMLRLFAGAGVDLIPDLAALGAIDRAGAFGCCF
jgi:hypothetical protein